MATALLRRASTTWWVVTGVRFGLLAMVFILVAITGTAATVWASLLGLTLLATAVSLPVRASWQPWIPVLEATAAAVVIGATRPFEPALLPYLIGPGLAAGLFGGVISAIIAPGIAALVLLASPALSPIGVDLRTYSTDVAPWILLSLVTGGLGAWLRRFQEESSVEDEDYRAAYRLLSELQSVVRQLSLGLDSSTIANSIIEQARREVSHRHAALYGLTPNGQTLPLARTGQPVENWPPTHGVQPGLSAALADGAARAIVLEEGGPLQSFVGIVPLRAGGKAIAVLVLERVEAAFVPEDLQALQTELGVAAGKLETAQLFEEISAVATTEERRRLAREIHDGIAQELASIGYVIDDLLSEAESAATIRGLRDLRSELSRLVSEIRLSVFDLRSDVRESVGLGAALAEYVRGISASTPLKVHLLLDERSVRLPIPVEVELLRIAQEAATNARKHANAKTLWVTCLVDSPKALLRVSDDGRGLGKARKDSFGMSIMAERAARIGGSLTIEPRHAGGTVVEVRVGDIADDAVIDRVSAPDALTPG